MKRLRLIISGDVIGVGYRAWVKRIALNLGLVGWVKNREDHTVEVVVEGPEKQLNTLLLQCKKGPLVSWVRNVHASWGKATGELVGFEVVY